MLSLQRSHGSSHHREKQSNCNCPCCCSCFPDPIENVVVVVEEAAGDGGVDVFEVEGSCVEVTEPGDDALRGGGRVLRGGGVKKWRVIWSLGKFGLVCQEIGPHIRLVWPCGYLFEVFFPIDPLFVNC